MSWQMLGAASRIAARRVLLPTAVGGTGLGLVAAVVLAGGLLSSSVGSSSAAAQEVTCAAPGFTLTQLHLDKEQSANATLIVTTGINAGLPEKAEVVAIAAALQESSLRNLTSGDLDSVGLFQMRPSMGWGTRAQLLDASYSTHKFYTTLMSVPGWQDLSVNDDAQAVERSGFPNAYGQHEQEAVQIVSAIRVQLPQGSAATPLPSPSVQAAGASGCNTVPTVDSGPTARMVQVAVGEIGKPYLWGGTGPDAFDCSGLIVYAWRQVGYQLTVRTSEDMWQVVTPVPAGQEQPGDLIFSQWGENHVPGPGHVQIVVTKGTLVEAPRTGLDVRETPYSYSSKISFGRLPTSAMKPVGT